MYKPCLGVVQCDNACVSCQRTTIRLVSAGTDRAWRRLWAWLLLRQVPSTDDEITEKGQAAADQNQKGEQ